MDDLRRKSKPINLAALDAFGKRLRFSRQDANLSQIELRERLEVYGIGIGASYISEMERKGAKPTLPVAAALAKVLNISLDYLAGLTDDPSPKHELDNAPNYITPEADQVAELVDTMSLKHRTLMLELARALADR